MWSQMVNGAGKSAEDFVQVLQQLTSRTDLDALTLILLRSILPDRGLLRSRRSWCPACYGIWYETGKTLYDPLIWMLRPVTVCPVHDQILQSKCPRCNRLLMPLDRHYRPGFCSRCGSFLGNSCIETPESLQRVTHWDRWVTENVGELIAMLPTLRESPLPPIQRGVRTIVETHYQGNIAEFARTIGVSKTTAWGWVSGKNRPPITGLLNICYSVSIRLTDLLVNRVLAPASPKPYPDYESRNGSSASRLWTRSALQVAEEHSFALSARKLSIMLGIDRKTLKIRLPSLVTKLSQRYQCLKTAKAAARFFKDASRICRSVKVLLENCIYPSRRRVETVSQRPSLLRSRSNQYVWKTILRRNNDV